MAEERVYKKGDKVRFLHPPKSRALRDHFGMAQKYLDRGRIYTVEHYFYGEPPQIEIQELEGADVLFAADMFSPV